MAMIGFSAGKTSDSQFTWVSPCSPSDDGRSIDRSAVRRTDGVHDGHHVLVLVSGPGRGGVLLLRAGHHPQVQTVRGGDRAGQLHVLEGVPERETGRVVLLDDEGTLAGPHRRGE